jgi:hypothetical protein
MFAALASLAQNSNDVQGRISDGNGLVLFLAAMRSFSDPTAIKEVSGNLMNAMR